MSRRAGFLCAGLAAVLLAPVSFAQSESLGWVGELFPAGGSSNSVAIGGEFTVYVQVWKAGVTDSPGQGANITCSLWWSEVNSFGGPWLAETGTAMTYNTDVGNNDEYQVSVSPPEGIYEYTAFCTDTVDSAVTWVGTANGRLTVAPGGTVTGINALWMDEQTIGWGTTHGPDNVSYELLHAPDGGLEVPVTAGSGLSLTFQQFLTASSYPKYPNANGYKALRLAGSDLAQVPDLLKGELAIAVYDGSGNILEATGIQLQGVLDDVFPYSGPLGVRFEGGVPVFRLWAPTARSINMRHFGSPFSSGIPVPMTVDPSTGVWSLTGDAAWIGDYYWYQVTVWVDGTKRVEQNLVTDPYAVNLSTDGLRGQIVDLDDPALAPPGWDSLTLPTVAAPEDIAIYELHVRDFSVNDSTVAPEHRGTYLAFTYDGVQRPLSDGMRHLIELAEAGLTHIHLLPVFDFASIRERPADRTEPDPALLASFPADSDEQQSVVGATAGVDGFNWGYDPVHFGAPEGSYATVQDGTARVLELREAIASLANNGLRVILDVVYNHTSSAGQFPDSVLDKIVPGYYHRLSNGGDIEMSSCCNDTATEFAMGEKLMIDTAVRWVRDYRVGGFRFDLMSLHTRDNMVVLRDTLHALTTEQDGVDGSQIYLYGEGWDTGSAKAKGLVYAYQWHVAGTGIGTFNDRIRDAVHGGISGDSLGIRKQGFANGQAYEWNGVFYSERFQGNLRSSQDRLRIGLAGNLQNYVLVDQNNNSVAGANLSGTGYTLDPQEAIQYVTKHDNETLYDLNVYKALAGTTMADRVRMQNMALSLVTLAQGVPFYHAGSDILRSKSMDVNSFDSGDWFNRLDFSYQSNNFGVGLPPAGSNSGKWSIMAPLLADSALYPAETDIRASNTHLREMLGIRASSPLFRLRTEADVLARLSFHNTGSAQSDGLIVMELADDIEPDLDSSWENIVVVFNANKVTQNFTVGGLAGVPFGLHPVQQSSADATVGGAAYDEASGNFSVPARTTAVFVSPPHTADTDSDGVPDLTDNCTTVANADQLDSDGDLIGNACDADIAPQPNDCVVSFEDLNAIKLAFFASPGDPDWDAAADFDGNATIDFADLNRIKLGFFAPPGPSAAGCN